MAAIKTYQEEYENLVKLGEGGFAKVYKARHRTFGYICAVRRLNGNITSETDETYLKFIKECRDLLLIGSGGHSNIVKISQPRLLYHTDEREKQACVEMEYIKGLDIAKFIKQENNFIPAREVVNFVKDIGSALAYCHYDIYKFLVNADEEYGYKLDGNLKGRKFSVTSDPHDNVIITPQQERELVNEFKVTHNDIHAGNIIRKYNGSYILLDFGLAIQGDEVVRSSKKQAGVPQYWSPERFEDKISEQSDIYAFGCLAYYMLAGRLPYIYSEQDKQNSFEPEEVQLQRKHTDPKQLVPPVEPLRRAAYEAANPGKTYTKDYPDWLERVIMKCLEKKPENRYANGKELYEEVKLLAEATNAAPDFDNLKTRAEIVTLKEQQKKWIEEKSKLEQQIKNQKPIEKIIEVPVEKTVEKIIAVPVEKIIEKPVEKIVRKTNPAWIVFCCIFAVATIGISAYEFANNGVSSNQEVLVSDEAMRQQLTDKQATIEQLQSEVSSLKQQLSAAGSSDNSARLQRIINERDNEIGKLKKQLAAKPNNTAGSDNSAGLQRQINSKNSEITRLNNEITSLKEQLKDKQKKLDAFLNNM
jgi:serine/threonine protein kinase